MTSSTKVPVKALRSLRALRFQDRFQNLRRRAHGSGQRRARRRGPDSARQHHRGLSSATPPPQRSRTSRTAHRSKRTPSASHPRARSFFQSLALARVRRAAVVKSGRRPRALRPSAAPPIQDAARPRTTRGSSCPRPCPPASRLRTTCASRCLSSSARVLNRTPVVAHWCGRRGAAERQPRARRGGAALVARVEVRGQRGGSWIEGVRGSAASSVDGGGARGGAGGGGGGGGEAEAPEPPPPADPARCAAFAAAMDLSSALTSPPPCTMDASPDRPRRRSARQRRLGGGRPPPRFETHRTTTPPRPAVSPWRWRPESFAGKPRSTCSAAAPCSSWCFRPAPRTRRGTGPAGSARSTPRSAP